MKLPHRALVRRTRSQGSRVANIHGNNFESAIIASQSVAGERVVSLIAWPKSGGRFIGAGKAISLPIAFDFSGTAALIFPGRHICFDAKSCEDEYGFEFSNPKIVKPHQRAELLRQGEAGAIAGILVECRARHDYRWMDWQKFQRLSYVGWNMPDWFVLGPTALQVPFRKLLEFYKGKEVT